jgi:hypothetical protein
MLLSNNIEVFLLHLLKAKNIECKVTPTNVKKASGEKNTVNLIISRSIR